MLIKLESSGVGLRYEDQMVPLFTHIFLVSCHLFVLIKQTCREAKTGDL